MKRYLFVDKPSHRTLHQSSPGTGEEGMGRPQLKISRKIKCPSTTSEQMSVLLTSAKCTTTGTGQRATQVATADFVSSILWLQCSQALTQAEVCAQHCSWGTKPNVGNPPELPFCSWRTGECNSLYSKSTQQTTDANKAALRFGRRL